MNDEHIVILKTELFTQYGTEMHLDSPNQLSMDFIPIDEENETNFKGYLYGSYFGNAPVCIGEMLVDFDGTKINVTSLELYKQVIENTLNTPRETTIALEMPVIDPHTIGWWLNSVSALANFISQTFVGRETSKSDRYLVKSLEGTYAAMAFMSFLRDRTIDQIQEYTDNDTNQDSEK